MKFTQSGLREFSFEGWASVGRFYFSGDKNDNGYKLTIEITTNQDDNGDGPQVLEITGPNMEIPDFLELVEGIRKVFYNEKFIPMGSEIS